MKLEITSEGMFTDDIPVIIVKREINNISFEILQVSEDDGHIIEEEIVFLSKEMIHHFCSDKGDYVTCDMECNNCSIYEETINGGYGIPYP
jgi:hypothetical protein